MKTRIEVVNLITGVEISVDFYNENGETDAQVQTRMDAYIALMQAKADRGLGWGWSARRVLKSETPELPTEFIPFIATETAEYWDLNKTYSYETQDLTTEYDAELAEDAADATTLEEIKQAVSIIDGWTQLSDININFLKKFFKYLIKKSI